MAKKRTKRPRPAPRAVTAERASRLHRLLKLLGNGPKTRDALTKQLRLDVRGFYRDLELLRGADIAVQLKNRRYVLGEEVGRAVARLPFPDPRLTLGEAVQLGKGRTSAHRKIQEQVAEILG